MRTNEENSWDGKVANNCGGDHTIYAQVIDAAGQPLIGVIVGEFTSSIEGLGLFISQASSNYDPAGVFAGIAILLVFIFTANAVATRLERRLLRWQPPVQGTLHPEI